MLGSTKPLPTITSSQMAVEDNTVLSSEYVNLFGVEVPVWMVALVIAGVLLVLMDSGGHGRRKDA